MSDFSLTLVLHFKTSKIINDMAKVQQKSEKITAFGGIFFVLDKFDSILSSVIDSHLGLRSTLIGYQSPTRSSNSSRGTYQSPSRSGESGNSRGTYQSPSRSGGTYQSPSRSSSGSYQSPSRSSSSGATRSSSFGGFSGGASRGGGGFSGGGSRGSGGGGSSRGGRR